MLGFRIHCHAKLEIRNARLRTEFNRSNRGIGEIIKS
jgi:hypothetical protein